MADAGLFGYGYRLGPRVPLGPRDAMDSPTRVPRDITPSQVHPRAGSSTCDSTNSNLCEKPVSNSMTVPIALGVTIPIVVAIGVLLYLHRRNVKKQKKEDLMDPHKSLDFGLVMDPTKGGKRGKGNQKNGFGAEKEGGMTTRHRQLSMDMDLSSPYLLPPGLQSSRESLHSLARTLHQNEDPYRPVASYATSDVGSLRSFRKDGRDGSSVYTGSSGGRDSATHPRPANSSTTLVAPPRQNSLPKTPSPPPQQSPLHAERSLPEVTMPAPVLPSQERIVPLEPTIPVIETMPYPDDKPYMEPLGMPMPVVQEPPPVAQKVSRKGLPASPKRSQDSIHQETYTMPDTHVVQDSHMYDNNYNGFDHQGPLMYTEPEAIGLGLTGGPQPQQTHVHMSPPQVNVTPEYSEYSHDRHTIPPAPLSAPLENEHSGHYDNHYYNMPAEVHDDQYGYDDRGRSLHRRQSSHYAEDVGQGGLGVPQQDMKRLSVGFRPLPPDEMMDTEDPETRANRIRSFYKEYFDDSKQDPASQQQYANANMNYYEDYDQSYLGEAAFFDPDTNAFVMPYAQPVARRAMTPPPSGSRFPGPRGGPRGPGPRNFHGSVGGMSLPGGRGPPRPGSTASSGRWGPRPGSSASHQWGRPRAGSTISARTGSRKPMAPPASLTTLPTPSKLRDDSFALMGAIDFAPPPTYRDQATGRSQSPLGERRPYQMKMPISSPLVSSYDDMAPLPSPHLLRRSGTFTGLDFAPPRKFKDSDTMSDAGSIRSNRSGISAVQQQALRSGAGRISRLPGDTVFTQAAQTNQLKPQWGMRD